MDPWEDAYRLWLGSRRAANTRAAYQAAWDDLLQGRAVREIRRLDVLHWSSEMAQRGLAPKTIALRLAAISSFYRYAATVYLVDDGHGQEVPLVERNPVDSVPKPRGRARRPAYYLTAEQAQALLAVIAGRDDYHGRRDYALYLGYILLGRRNTEVRTLRWGDFREERGVVWYSWSGKGKTGELAECPGIVWEAICNYLREAGRLETIRKTDFIFTAKGQRAPLSMREVGRKLKYYAGLAGLNVEQIHVHSLRHTAAMLRRAAGDTVDEISSLLSHSSIAVTDTYLHQLEGRRDVSSQRVVELLNLG